MAVVTGVAVGIVAAVDTADVIVVGTARAVVNVGAVIGFVGAVSAAGVISAVVDVVVAAAAEAVVGVDEMSSK